jgi:hypothetical protein
MKTPIIFKQRTLSDCSPRLASTLTLINIPTPLPLDLFLSKHDKETQILISDAFEHYLKDLSHP